MTTMLLVRHCPTRNSEKSLVILRNKSTNFSYTPSQFLIYIALAEVHGVKRNPVQGFLLNQPPHTHPTLLQLYLALIQFLHSWQFILKYKLGLPMPNLVRIIVGQGFVNIKEATSKQKESSSKDARRGSLWIEKEETSEPSKRQSFQCFIILNVLYIYPSFKIHLNNFFYF